MPHVCYSIPVIDGNNGQGDQHFPHMYCQWSSPGFWFKNGGRWEKNRSNCHVYAGTVGANDIGRGTAVIGSELQIKQRREVRQFYFFWRPYIDQYPNNPKEDDYFGMGPRVSLIPTKNYSEGTRIRH